MQRAIRTMPQATCRRQEINKSPHFDAVPPAREQGDSRLGYGAAACGVMPKWFGRRVACSSLPTKASQVGRNGHRWICNSQKSGLSAVGTAASFSVPYLCGFSAQTCSGQSRKTRR